MNINEQIFKGNLSGGLHDDHIHHPCWRHGRVETSEAFVGTYTMGFLFLLVLTAFDISYLSAIHSHTIFLERAARTGKPALTKHSGLLRVRMTMLHLRYRSCMSGTAIAPHFHVSAFSSSCNSASRDKLLLCGLVIFELYSCWHRSVFFSFLIGYHFDLAPFSLAIACPRQGCLTTALLVWM
jgi:hypothetical protein